MITLFGIANCDTVKKARKWLDEAGVEYNFHDFRQDGLEATQVRGWIDELGWEAIVNRRSTTWRGLGDEVKSGMDASSAEVEIVKAPTLVKRPVLDTGDARYVGFSATTYAELFS